MPSVKKNLSTERRKKGKKLRAWGMDEHEIELCLNQMRERQALKARGLLPLDAPLCDRPEYNRYVRESTNTYKNNQLIINATEPLATDDAKGYAPTYVDPLLKGAARATGATAKVVKRGRTMTKFQYDKQEG